MFAVNGIQFSYFDLSLTFLFVAMAVVCVVSLRKIALLELRVQHFQKMTQRDVSMVNQGAIGMGRRLAKIEKELKKSSNVANFPSAKAKASRDNSQPAQHSKFESVANSVQNQSAPPPLKTQTRPVEKSTRAEQALSAWISKNQSA